MDARQFHLLINSIEIALGTSFLSTLIGIPLGFVLSRTNFFARRLVNYLLLFPLLVPPYIFAIAWLNFFLRFRLLLFSVGLDMLAPQPYVLTFAIFMLTLSYFPLVTFFSSFAFRGIDFHLEEAASLVSKPSKIFRKITLPLISPIIAAAFMLIFALTILEFGTPSLLEVNVFVAEIYAQFSAFFNYGQAYLLSIPLILLSGISIVTLILLLKKQRFTTISGSSNQLSLIKLSQKWQVIIGILLLILFAFAVAIPAFALIVQSDLLKNPLNSIGNHGLEALVRSLWVSSIAALMMVGISGFVIYFFNQKLKPLIPLFLVPLTIPSVSIAILLIMIFNQPLFLPIYRSSWLLIIGLLIKFLPFTLISLFAFVTQLDPHIIEIAKTTESSPSKIFRRIIIPLLTPGLIVTWFVGFILAISDLGLSLLLAPPGFQTLPVRIYIMIHYGSAEPVATFSLLLVLLIILAITIAQFLYKRNQNGKLLAA